MPDEDAPGAATLVIADDYPLFVEGLCARIADDHRFRLVGLATDGPGAVQVCSRHHPGVALVGYFLPRLRGVALLEALWAASPGTGVAVLAGVVDADVVHEAVAVGARGFVLKQETGPAILDALHRVSQGATAFSPAAQACLVDAVRARADASDGVPSPRESQILRFLADGATSREVAERLFVSEATVKSHLNRLYKKLGVNDRAAAVAQALRRDWVS